MSLPIEVVEAIREQARKDHKPDAERWNAVLATVRVVKRAQTRESRAA